MGFSYTDLKYGWKVLAGIVITGTTIYILNNTRVEVQQIDIIPIALGTYERALATQFSTNPVDFRVHAPDFTRTWYTNNPYSVVTNSVTNWYMARYTNVVTNTIGYFIDKPMMDSLDDTIKGLVTYYGWSNSPGENMTVTGLWAYLGIGDGTNKFTSVPCWTNDAQVVYPINFTNYYPNTNAPTTNSFTSLYPETVRYAYGFWSNGYYWTNRLFSASNVITTTNLATYGNYAQQIYVEALQERYKVLNAMRYMIDENKTTISNLYDRDVTFVNATYKMGYSNLVTGAYPVYGYVPGVSGAHDAEFIAYLGLDYYEDDPDYVFLGPQSSGSEIIWGQAHGWAETDWSYGPSQTNNTANNLEFFYHAYKYPHSMLTNYTYEYRTEIRKSRAVLKWANYQYTNIPSTFYAYAANATKIVGINDTVIVTNSYTWYYPQSWERTFDSVFEEGFIEGSSYTLIDNAFIDVEGIYNVLNLGWDEFTYPGSVPPPTAPAEPTGGIAYNDNTGSIGTSRGMTIPLSNIKGVRDFQFNYCATRFW